MTSFVHTQAMPLLLQVWGYRLHRLHYLGTLLAILVTGVLPLGLLLYWSVGHFRKAENWKLKMRSLVFVQVLYIN